MAEGKISVPLVSELQNNEILYCETYPNIRKLPLTHLIYIFFGIFCLDLNTERNIIHIFTEYLLKVSKQLKYHKDTKPAALQEELEAARLIQHYYCDMLQEK